MLISIYCRYSISRWPFNVCSTPTCTVCHQLCLSPCKFDWIWRTKSGMIIIVNLKNLYAHAVSFKLKLKLTRHFHVSVQWKILSGDPRKACFISQWIQNLTDSGVSQFYTVKGLSIASTLCTATWSMKKSHGCAELAATSAFLEQRDTLRPKSFSLSRAETDVQSDLLSFREYA